MATRPKKSADEKPATKAKKAPSKTKEAATPKKTAAKASKGKTPNPVAKATNASLVTGFPGFLATHLMLELLDRDPSADYHFVIEARFDAEARKRIERLRRERPAFTGRLEIHHGDITKPMLGFEESTFDALRADITHVWHLAALYDLAVPEEIAYRVNVRGTAHVLDFCEACSRLRRLNYVSTCFVSGKRTGRIREDELDEGQAHHNHYESTKFWAEMEVQRRMGTLPVTIFRPSIVVGHSRTGETDKYDGPYYLLKIIKRMPKWLPFVNIGRGETVVNIIPVDFAAASIAYLGLLDGTEGQVFQVADANPMRARDIVALGLRFLGKPAAVGMIPPGLAERAMKSDTLERTLGVPRQILGYFTHDARYDTANLARHLQGAGIKCPHLSTYLQVLVDYYEAHSDRTFLDGRRV
ncbi:MAG: SDR family oxidoreductase [bacterium]